MAGIKDFRNHYYLTCFIIFYNETILPFFMRWLNFIINTALVTLAFAGSIGMTLVILGCALPDYRVWWPFFVVLFYILAPIPTLIARRHSDVGSTSNPCLELAIFVTMGFVISSFALPIVLARSPNNSPVIQWGACYLIIAGNIVVYLTILGFFIAFDHDDSDYSMW